MNSESAAARDKLAADLKAVVADTEELLRATAGQAGDKVHAARQRAEETLKAARARMVEVEQAAVDQARAAARTADKYVHDNPWQAVGVAAGVGLLVGLLMSSCRHR